MQERIVSYGLTFNLNKKTWDLQFRTDSMASVDPPINVVLTAG